MDEDDLFAQEMGQVQPIQAKKKRIEPKKAKKHVLDWIASPKEDVFEPQAHSTSKMKEKEDHVWQLCRSGVSAKKCKALAQANIHVELDLHGLSQAQAHIALADFVGKALQQHQRHIRVVHGKGLHSKDKPILKSAVYDWFKHGQFAAHILAVVPAPYSTGGACHVLLRRMDKAGILNKR